MSSTHLQTYGMSTPAKPVAVPADVSHQKCLRQPCPPLWDLRSILAAISVVLQACPLLQHQRLLEQHQPVFCMVIIIACIPAVSSFPMSSPASTSSPRVRQFNDGPFSGGFRSNVYYH
ncbi:hypothetical protein BSLG_005854 [Batrachochytrium salamandrivorans]|nr:hypothetical protein BSLG_005854 [Batrachochytrium salamandrivorans]